MTDTDYSTTQLQKKIYVLLINYRNPKFPNTQKQVCKQLGASKSTVSDATKKLIDLGFIAPYSGMKTNILYRKATNHKIIEAQIKDNYLEAGEWFDVNGQGIRPPNTAESYRPTYRAHVNGTWIKFTVAQKGDLDTIPVLQNDGSRINIALFGNTKPTAINGSINWYSKVFFSKVWISIRYQESAKYKFFYVQPSSQIVTTDHITPDEDILTPFISQCTPLLQHLEKYGSWRFKHTETGDYEVEASVRTGKTGSQKEYGFDDFLTTTLHDYVGDVGIVGSSPLWFDRSEGAQGDLGEMETSKADYVNAIDRLPHTTQMVCQLIESNKQLTIQVLKDKSEILTLIQQVQEQQRQILQLVATQSGIPDKISIPTGGMKEQGVI